MSVYRYLVASDIQLISLDYVGKYYSKEKKALYAMKGAKIADVEGNVRRRIGADGIY